MLQMVRCFGRFGGFDDLNGPLLLPAQLVIQKKACRPERKLGATGFLYTKQTF
ncbi:hypothetical protein [Paenibacillus chitinolyticus]|uniref:hypothetical protein n=1 Tax=Paenibacillus chitinolyticus TaxID=79263 RepID=UPI00363D7BD5